MNSGFSHRDEGNKLKRSKSVLEWLVDQCGLGEEHLDKLREQQINDENIGFLA